MMMQIRTLKTAEAAENMWGIYKVLIKAVASLVTRKKTMAV